ncbi:MAG TPA: site-specific integrase, partial [Casimicrobium sp.]|nr:site-specific integrase [Casimicrobium sp.]
MKVHSAQIDLFPLNLHDHDAINRLLAALPPLPPVIRYFDDFDEKPCSIRAPSQLTEFQLAIRGLVIKIDFSRFESNHALLLKQVFLFLLGEDLSVSTATLYIQSATHLSAEDVASLIGATPHGIVQLWAKLRGRDMPVQSYSLAKALLRLMCRHRLHDWSDEYETFI